MEEIFAQTSTFPADATIIAVIYALIGIIVPKLADIAIVPGCSFPTTNAELTGPLCTSTDHAEHIFGCFAIQNVVFDLIMT